MWVSEVSYRARTPNEVLRGGSVSFSGGLYAAGLVVAVGSGEYHNSTYIWRGEQNYRRCEMQVRPTGRLFEDVF